MGTARRFSRALHDEIDVYAAWLPVTNNFRLGDYGVISDGVFAKLGNIDEFKVKFNEEDGAQSHLKFRSAGTKVGHFVAGASAPALPQADIDAKLVIEFTAGDSFYINANLTSSEMQNVAQVGRALHRVEGWRPKYRVISSIYAAKHCTIISSRKAGSKIELSGTANALQMLELGQASAGVTVSSEESVGLELIGRSGVVGLRMFKLRRFGDGLEILLNEEVEETELIEQDEADDLEDDV